MSKQQQILIDDNSTKTTDEKSVPLRRLSFQTKFFCSLFGVIVIYHFISSYNSSNQINSLNTKLRDADKQKSDLLLKKQGLELNLKNLSEKFDEAQSNIKYVENARQGSINEVKKLTGVITGFKKGLSQGTKLEIKRLEEKLLEWEQYQKKVEDVLTNRPRVFGQ